MSELVVVKKKEFKAPLCSENSFGTVAKYEECEQEMTLYKNGSNSYFIEWLIPSVDESAEIGLWFEGDENHIDLQFNELTLADYDGVFELPSQAIELLREVGFIVPESFEEDK